MAIAVRNSSKTQVAEPPEELGSDKYDVSVASTIAPYAIEEFGRN